ncbi:MAG: hypothetical protein M1817_002288 [Caeruleum heppii]|nr:MAG: hypothetical protein M1817_003527 [Caeruleum heppii]KAI9673651.1 MAG: hypothetical protein M1817_002288 [Caeruleum heppii]
MELPNRAFELILDPSPATVTRSDELESPQTTLVPVESSPSTLAAEIPRRCVHILPFPPGPIQRTKLTRLLTSGFDLLGNTYWEFRDSLTQGRFRRIVQYPRSVHYSDIQITPQWHQWLRHTRQSPPSLTEQRQDVARQQSLKELARLADERWASKPSFLDRPEDTGQPRPATEVKDPGGYAPPTEDEGKRGVRNAVGAPDEVAAGEKAATPAKEKNPWDINRGGPSEQWQPEAWNPSSAPARR